MTSQESKQKILELFSALSYNDMRFMKAMVSDICKDKFHELFKVIEIFSTRGNIAHEIHEQTGFECVWEGRKGYCGSLKLIIPVEKWSEALAIDIKEKYDSYFKADQAEKVK